MDVLHNTKIAKNCLNICNHFSDVILSVANGPFLQQVMASWPVTALEEQLDGLLVGQAYKDHIGIKSLQQNSFLISAKVKYQEFTFCLLKEDL